MKAIVFHEHGGLDVLQLADLPTPQPGPGEVLIELKAAALNHVDLIVRRGWPGLSLEFPHIPGADGAGVVTRLGDGVQSVSVGGRVVINANLSCGRCGYCLAGKDNLCEEWELLGETVSGTYAEYIAISELNVLPIPDHISFAEAAASSLVFQTAWHSLITRGRLQAGETVLIVGASGGVNTASIQVAKLAGAEVFVVGSSEEKLELARSLGADHLVDRSAVSNWSKAAYLASGKVGFDVVVDNVGQATLPSSLRAARRGGRILTVGNTSGPKVELDNRYVFGKHLSILGSTMGPRADFQRAMEMVFAGKLHAVIGARFPWTEARVAQELLDKGQQMGKVVLEFDA